MSKRFSTISAVVLILGQILSMYGWGSLNFELIITTFLLIIYLYKYGYKNNTPKYLTIYVIYYWITSIICFTSISDLFPFGIIRKYLLYGYFIQVIQLSELKKIYRIVAYVCIIFFGFQEITLQITGYKISGVSDYLPLSFVDTSDAAKYRDSVVNLDRCASFFREPAHFAQFLLPYLAFSIFQENNRRKFLDVVIITIVLIFLRSGNALIGLGVILIMYFGNMLKTTKKNKVILSLGVAILASTSLVLYQKSEMGAKMLERKDTIMLSDEAEVTSSGFLRIVRGYLLYEELPTISKLIGCNNQNKIDEYINSPSLYLYFTAIPDYFNGVQEVLIRTGIIGLLIFTMLIKSLWGKNTQTGKAILLLFVVISFVGTTFFSSLMLLYIVIATKEKRQNLLRIKYEKNRINDNNLILSSL